MKLDIENDFRQKIMVMGFKEPVVIQSKAEIDAWKQAWLKELASWHSPYKLLIDGSNLTIKPYEKLTSDLDLLLQFFKGFFLRKAVAFGVKLEDVEPSQLPFPIKVTQEEASEELGVRTAKKKLDPTDFRGQIQIENDFRAHVMELSFANDVVIDDSNKVATLKSKITNNLMQWHSKWNLLVDCTHLEVGEEVQGELEKALLYFKGFFMTTVIGYSPHSKEATYPFEIYRSRHKAVTQLERIGALSGNEAHCLSNKSTT